MSSQRPPQVQVPTLEQIRKRLDDPIYQRAMELHRRNGHPEGYVGPCWGPTLAELDEAKRTAEDG